MNKDYTKTLLHGRREAAKLELLLAAETMNPGYAETIKRREEEIRQLTNSLIKLGYEQAPVLTVVGGPIFKKKCRNCRFCADNGMNIYSCIEKMPSEIIDNIDEDYCSAWFDVTSNAVLGVNMTIVDNCNCTIPQLDTTTSYCFKCSKHRYEL